MRSQSTPPADVVSLQHGVGVACVQKMRTALFSPHKKKMPFLFTFHVFLSEKDIHLLTTWSCTVSFSAHDDGADPSR